MDYFPQDTGECELYSDINVTNVKTTISQFYILRIFEVLHVCYNAALP